ncbi:MAG: SRPBCC family protein [Steroidobacteraceae bacterium]|nr:SRPBCC family protein [Steroidobacteraceae bacterium]
MVMETYGQSAVRPRRPEPWAHPAEASHEPHWHEEYAYEPSEHRWLDDQRLTQALGWFSIGIGLTELLAPRALGRAIGVGDHPAVFRMLGVRELVSGACLLSGRSPAVWAWSRVAGDAMDLTLLGAALRAPKAQAERIAVAGAVVLGAAALDVYAGQRLMRREISPPQVRVSEVVSINASPEELYTFWKKLDNLPRFMQHVQSVSRTNDRISHWVAKAPAGATIEWDAEIIDDQPNARLGWRTLPDSEIRHEGAVSFVRGAGGRGSIVHCELFYQPPAGRLGAALSSLLGEEPRKQINDDLRRLKQLIETGEVATTLGQPAGRRSLIGRVALGRRLQ